ncbi:ATP-binding response regulator [Azospirillum soli]|uniref:ATP-binding response regulator n=1 Tax=Azospirillum soli TaxID=1304799 RepID=UPI001AE44BF7|nr:ATP-binding protein [Azospirillum soli]MBP2311300.1 signal transduction histidine kinase [Azospirillum soli]
MTERAVWLDALVSANGAPHALLSPDGRLLVVNRAFAAAHGCLPDAVEGKALADLGIPAALVPQLEAQLRRVAATGTPVTIPGLLPGAEATLTPVRDADGAVTSIAAIGGMIAIAAIGDADAALLAAREEAERARAETEKARSAQGRFLSAASHDLRQPFQAMHLFHHLLMGRLADPASRELGDKLEQAITAGETLLRALLEVSALEAGLVKPQAQTFPVDDSLGRLLQEFAPQAEAKGLRFNARPADVEVTTDPVLLERLLRPLLSNAIRYTEKGGVLLAARRRGDALRIEVWDTGIGIAETDLQVIFEDFKQLGNPSRDRKQGLGLGLGIARRLAEVLGLPVTVRSKPGKGSVFAVDVPLADAERGGDDREDEPEATDSTSGANSDKGTVLVIEDDAIQLEGINLLLRDWGYDVIPTRNLAEAYASLAAAPAAPDLVLSDLGLNGPETGIEAIKAVRARCGRVVPGVIVTGDTDPDRLRSIDRSGFGIVHKPYDPVALKSLLARTLSGAGVSCRV